MYAMVYTRANIAYVETVVSKFMSNPSKECWDVVKWIMKYLRGTFDHGMVLGKSKQEIDEVRGYVDSDPYEIWTKRNQFQVTCSCWITTWSIGR